MIRLLYITNQICGPGGLERVLSIKTDNLVKDYDYEIHICTLNQGGQSLFYQFNKSLRFHDINVSGNAVTYFLRYRNGIRKLIKKIDPDIVVVCDDGLKGLLFPILVGKKIPMVYERHVSKNIEKRKDSPNFFEGIKTAVIFKLMDFGGNFYDRFVVLTEGNRKEWDLKNIQVLPNPLSFFPDETSHLKNKKVIAVGKQSFQKGYDRLLKSWKTVSKVYPDWELDIYGTISSSLKLENQAKDLSIANVVHFYPPTKNIAEKYKESSIYVMSSRYEGFGMVLTEAMAYGVPCISFDCPYGPSDIITHGEDGLLVENGDIDGLADAIITIIDDQEKRKQMGVKARLNVLRYRPETIAEKWDNLFRKLLN